jgi:glycosyltransferase involved in cell wall biosynthesis
MASETYPVISVVTCAYKSEAFLVRALDSVEAQSYPHIEHILNYSPSTDGTLAILEGYLARVQGRYPVRLGESAPGGVGHALNVATGYATGDVIHYLHGDDYYLGPDSLAKVAGHFRADPELVWLTGNFVVEWRGRRIILPQTVILQPSLEIALSMMNFISHENTFMKTEAVTEYGGFNETKNDVVEYSLWLKLLRAHQPLIVNDEFCVFIIHKGSTSTGSVFSFLKAVRRAFHTQHKEHMLPLVGYYPERRVYQGVRALIKRIAALRNLLGMRML